MFAGYTFADNKLFDTANDMDIVTDIYFDNESYITAVNNTINIYVAWLKISYDIIFNLEATLNNGVDVGASVKVPYPYYTFVDFSADSRIADKIESILTLYPCFALDGYYDVNGIVINEREYRVLSHSEITIKFSPIVTIKYDIGDAVEVVLIEGVSLESITKNIGDMVYYNALYPYTNLYLAGYRISGWQVSKGANNKLIYEDFTLTAEFVSDYADNNYVITLTTIYEASTYSITLRYVDRVSKLDDIDKPDYNKSVIVNTLPVEELIFAPPPFIPIKL